MTELGSALKFETDEPHFVSLGGGRLSIGVTLCPIKRGRSAEQSERENKHPLPRVIISVKLTNIVSCILGGKSSRH